MEEPTPGIEAVDEGLGDLNRKCGKRPQIGDD